MTEEELEKVKFHTVCHLVLVNENTMTYCSDNERLGFCDQTRRKKNGEFGRTTRHYRIDRRIFKTYKEFIEALKDFNPEDSSNN